MKKTLTLIAAAMLLGACASSKDSMDAGMKMDSPADQATAAIAAATAANKKAIAVGYEWRDTGKFIKNAKAAADKKDYAGAIKLAKKAEEQADDAVRQHAQQVAAFDKNFM